MTDRLKRKDANFKWAGEMEKEFQAIKMKMSEIRKLVLLDYEKPFMLHTDASNMGLSTVLLQKNANDKWVLIQWASNKLTPTEKRYEISKKEILAVVWGIEKFECKLRGRKFALVTSHEALKRIRWKPYSENHRINKCIERMQVLEF